MDRGWIKLHRKIDENIFLMHDNNAYIVFTKLLIHVDSNGRWAGGRKLLAKFMNMNESTLYKTLLRLDREQLITIESNSRYTIYSICNWSKYQQNGNSPNKLKVTAGEQPGNSPVTAREHYNNNKKENKNKEREVSKIETELAAKEKAAMEREPNGDTRDIADIVRERLVKKGILKA
jgi:hypothetical protein